ncbi:MAG: flagellar filament outer layer protein FlaA [Treponemataceae bacterium]|nr:flagellar filament outer layer protein FlaA [Spirochaetales bacterium]MDY6030310.1 flagellar filament outer layer protein FlaA [Treponemataceae bacterium]
MKKFLSIFLILTVAFYAAFAQESSLADPDASTIGADSAEQALKEVSVEMFEREGSWNVKISPDNGVITSRLFDGGPSGKQPLADMEDKEYEDSKVLGVKTEFFKRGINSFYIMSARPLAIEGVTKTVSVWVAGRNQGHSLTLLVQDYYGHNFELYMGTLDFSGWKQMKVAVPPSPDGVHGIVQQDSYLGDRPGLKIVGFRIDCDPMLARGAYYVYFDDLRAITDVYSLMNRDEDDMDDNW